MQVRKYQAGTIQEAVAMVRNVLGSEAMILSTKKLGKKGENSLFEIAAVPAGDHSSHTNLSPLREVKSELMSIREMIYLLNNSGGTFERIAGQQDDERPISPGEFRALGLSLEYG